MKNVKLVTRIFLIILFISDLQISYAGLLDGLGKVAGDVVKTGWRVTTAPYESIEKTTRVITGHEKPQSIINTYKKIAKSTGNTIDKVTNLSVNSQQILYKKINEFANRSSGGVGDFIFDISTFQNRYLNELGGATSRSLANTLRSQNPMQIIAAPLAGAIRAARAKLIVKAKPIPKDVRDALKGHFSYFVLNRAKYAVGRIDITLPNFIGKFHKLFGNDYAVVVDDIIVFQHEPPSYKDSAIWWAHEMTHVEQYHRWGVESFAYRYIKDLSSSIESEAVKRSYEITGNEVNTSSFASILSPQQLGLKTQIPNRGLNRTNNIPHHPNTEYFVAQCFFPMDPQPIYYMITNTRKLIAIDPFSGNWLHFGWATPPLAPGVAWTYQTASFRYAVFNNGNICTVDRFGRYIIIGYVVRYR